VSSSRKPTTTSSSGRRSSGSQLNIYYLFIFYILNLQLIVKSVMLSRGEMSEHGDTYLFYFSSLLPSPLSLPSPLPSLTSPPSILCSSRLSHPSPYLCLSSPLSLPSLLLPLSFPPLASLFPPSSSLSPPPQRCAPPGPGALPLVHGAEVRGSVCRSDQRRLDGLQPVLPVRAVRRGSGPGQHQRRRE